MQCETEWSAVLDSRKDSNTIERFTLVGDHEMLYMSEYSDPEQQEHTVYYATYLREGSEEMAHEEDYRYLQTVKVSNVKELM